MTQRHLAASDLYDRACNGIDVYLFDALATASTLHLVLPIAFFFHSSDNFV